MAILPPPRDGRRRVEDAPARALGSFDRWGAKPDGSTMADAPPLVGPPVVADPPVAAAAPIDAPPPAGRPVELDAPVVVPPIIAPQAASTAVVGPPPAAPPPAATTGVVAATALLDPPVMAPPAAAAAPASNGPTLFGPSASETATIDLREGSSHLLDPSGKPSTPGTLVAENLSAWFGSRKVLDRCSLGMEAGKVTAIIGPSGCGKSVFLRNLNRMHEVIPTAKMGGLISLDGEDIHSAALSPTEVRLRIGMVFQRPNPFPSMSIRENVLAGLKLSGTKTSDADGLVEWSLRRAGLWNEVKDRLDSGGAALSGGQQQRLCIARSLAVRPRVLLMDEPCSALDPISTRVIEETILEIAKDITIVIVTHSMQQAQRVADNCAFFLIEAIGDPGRIVESGATDQIFNNPRDPRTGDYVTGRFG